MEGNTKSPKWKRVYEGFEDVENPDEGDFYGLEELDPSEFKITGNSTPIVNSKKRANSDETGSSSNKKTKLSRQAKKDAKKDAKKKKEAQEKANSTKKTAAKDKKPVETKPEPKVLKDDNAFSALQLAEDDEVAYSLGSWPKDLDPKIYTGLKRLKFLSPTEIQAESIPPILAGKDVIGKAATGSGKTLAYSLPLLQRYYTTPENCAIRPEGLIVSPTRELAYQIRDHIQAVMPDKFLQKRVIAVTGGLSIQKQLRLLQNQPIVVVATPGRLNEVLEGMPHDQKSAWQKIPTLIIDEADRLIKAGSFAELENCISMIGVSKERQVLVYSATFSTAFWTSLAKKNKKSAAKPALKQGEKGGDENDIVLLMRKKLGLNNLATIIDVDPESQVSTSIKQAIIECPNMEKDLYLYYFLILYPGKSIVFVNSIDAVKRIVPLLKELGMPAFGVHSDMIQKQRMRSVEKFKATDNSILIGTDVAARGLDVPLVDHVVHYNLPRSADMYIHRSGRTARAGNEGVSVVLCSPQEKSGPLPNLLKLIGTKPQHLGVDYNILEQLRQRVKLAKEIADTRIISTKRGKTDTWLAQAAEDLGVDYDDDVDFQKKKDTKKTDGLSSQMAELKQLLGQKLGSKKQYLTSGTRNLAHELVTNPLNHVFGMPLKSALTELKSKKGAIAPTD